MPLRSTLITLLAFGAVIVIALQAHSFVPFLLTVSRLRSSSPSTAAAARSQRATVLPMGSDRCSTKWHVSRVMESKRGAVGNRRNTHFGWRENDAFDPLAEHGGSLVQSRGIGPVTTIDGTHDFVGEVPPPEANVTAMRETQSLQGLGFVDAVPDETWLAIAEAEFEADPATAGRVHMVFDLASRSAAVGKFGWKAQVPTLFQFAGDALLNEIGITSPGFRDEVCPQGDCHRTRLQPCAGTQR